MRVRSAQCACSAVAFAILLASAGARAQEVDCMAGVCTLDGQMSMLSCNTAADCSVAGMCALDMDAMLSGCPDRAPDPPCGPPIASVQPLDSSCPPPTVREGASGNCALDQDAVLPEALEVASFTRLDCKGHALLPASGGSLSTIAGAGTVSASGTTLTGAGTDFIHQLSIGSTITAAGQTRFILAIASATAATLDTALTVSGASYTVNLITNSSPRAAFVLDRAQGVRIQNCVIGSDGDRFDFGIIAAGNKADAAPGRSAHAVGNEFFNNSITTVKSAVTLLASDQNEVVGNTIEIQGAAAAIVLMRGADANRLIDNSLLIDGFGGPQSLLAQLPVPADELVQDYEAVPGFCRGFATTNRNAIHIRIETGRATVPASPASRLYASLINWNLAGRLLQFPLTPVLDGTGTAVGTRETSSNNLVDGNTLSRKIAADFGPCAANVCAGDGSSCQVDADCQRLTYGVTPNIFVDGGSGNTFTNNIVQRGWMGLVVTGQIVPLSLPENVFPGSCTKDSTRYCRTTDDCNIDLDGNGVIDPGESLGQCAGVMHVTTPADDSAHGAQVANNSFAGPYSCPFINSPIDMTFSVDYSVTGNSVVGNTTVPSTNPASASFSHAFGFRGTSAASGTISRNVFVGDRSGVVDISATTTFGAKFSLNDLDLGPGGRDFLYFHSASIAPGELSVNGQGNYWGHTCAEGGFLASDVPLDKSVCTSAHVCSRPPAVSCATDLDCKLLKDSHPFGQPVVNYCSGNPQRSCVLDNPATPQNEDTCAAAGWGTCTPVTTLPAPCR